MIKQAKMQRKAAKKLTGEKSTQSSHKSNATHQRKETSWKRFS